MLDSCWIHAFWKNRLESKFLDSKSKPPIQNAAENLDFFWQFQYIFGLQHGVEFMLNSCWIHAEFMHIQMCNIIFPFMSDSCQIHAEFMHFNDSEIWWCWLSVDSCQIRDEFIHIQYVLVYYWMFCHNHFIHSIIMAHCQTRWANRACLELIDL